MFCMAKVLLLAPTQDIYSDTFLDSGCGDQMPFDNYVPPHLLPQTPYRFLEMAFSQTACDPKLEPRACRSSAH